MKHRGSSPSFRASPPVTGVCSQPCGDGASSLDRLLGCEIRNDPLFFSVQDWKMSKMQYGRWNFQPFAEQPWLEVLSNFGGDPSIPRAAGLYCSLPVIFI